LLLIKCPDSCIVYNEEVDICSYPYKKPEKSVK
jgi:hypothetical protein